MAEQMVTEDELFNGDPDLREDSTDSNTQGNSSYSFDSGMSYDDILDVIMGRDGYISRPPNSESGWYVDPETGQAYTNYEAMSNEDRLAAWDAWYQEAEEYGYENLNANDQMLYIQNAYRLGYIDAETADEMWEPLHNEMMVANGWTLQEDGTWRREREGGGGRTIIETAEAPTFSEGNYGESGAWDGSIQGGDTPGVFSENYANMSNQWNNYERTVEGASGLQGLFATVMSEVVPVVVKGTLAWATGQALNPLIISALGNAGITGSAATAIASAVSSQVANGFISGEMSLEGALMAGLSGYLSAGGLEDLVGEASGTFDELMTTLNEAMELGTGSEFVAAMVQAGGTNILMQYAATGELDPLLLASSLATAGLVSELSDVVQQGFETGTITEDEFDAWLEEQEGLEQAFIDADIKDPFLNPNYTSVGEGLMVDAAGNVFNYDGDNMGTMDDLDLDGNGILDANDLQEVTVGAEPIPEETQFGNETFDGWLDYSSSGNISGGRYYMDEKGTLYHVDNVNLDANGNWVVDGGVNDGQIIEGNITQVYVDETGVVTNEEGGLVEWQSYYDDRTEEGVQYENIIGPDDQVMGEDLLGAPSDVMPGDYVNSEGQTVQYIGTQYGYVDSNGNWVPGTVGQETDIYWNPETQQYETRNGTIINFTEEPPEIPEPVEPEPEDVQQTETDPTDSTEQPETSVEAVPSDPAAGISSEIEQLQEQYQQAISEGDYVTANMIMAQIQQLQQEQAAVEDVTDDLEDTTTTIEDVNGTIPQPTTPEKPEDLPDLGVETGEEPTEDTRTEWQVNRDYIIAQVEAGTATEGQQAWYDSWVESGSPDTQEGMVQGDAADGTAGTTDPGEGGTGTDSETGGGGEDPGDTVGGTPDKPVLSPIGTATPGPTLGFGPGASTGAPGTGEGEGTGAGGGAGRRGMMTGGFKPAPFQPFRAGISYTAPSIAPIRTPPQKDYVRELDDLTARLSKGLFEGLV